MAKEYFQRRQQKLTEQFKELVKDTSSIFAGVTAAVDGYTAELSALEIKQILSEHGGMYAANVWNPSITHLICTNLPIAKVKKELETRRRKPLAIVTAKWIVDSVEAGKQLPIGQYIIPQLKNSKQSTLSKWYNAPSASSVEEQQQQHVIFRLKEDPIVLDACARLKIDLEASFVIVVCDNRICAVSHQTKQYLPATQLYLGQECRVQDGFVRRIQFQSKDGEQCAQKLVSVFQANCSSRFELLSSRECVAMGALDSNELALIKSQLESKCGCAVETKTVADWKQYKTDISSARDYSAWRNFPTTTAIAVDDVSKDDGNVISVEIIISDKHKPFASRLPALLCNRLTERNLDERIEFYEIVLDFSCGRQQVKVPANANLRGEIEYICNLVALDLLKTGDWLRMKLFHHELPVAAAPPPPSVAFPQSLDQIDLETLYELPAEIREAIQCEYEQVYNDVMDDDDDDDREEDEGNTSSRRSFPETFSQIDPKVLQELPHLLAHELEQAYKRRRINAITFPQESFASIRHVVVESFQEFASKACPLEDKTFSSSCINYMCECLIPTQELDSIVALVSLLSRLSESAQCATHNTTTNCWNAATSEIKLRVDEHFYSQFKSHLKFL